MDSAGPTVLPLQSRRATYALVLGVVLGLLIAGLAIPFLFGEPLDSPVTAIGSVPNGAAPAGGPAVSGQPVAGATQSGDPTAAGTQTAGGAVNATGNTGGLASDAPLPTLPPGVTLTASDRGVTASTITLGFLLVDLGGVGQFGFSVPGFDPESQMGYVNAYLDDINARGGIYGRTVVPTWFTYDPTDPSSGSAACRAATQDTENFAVLDMGGGLNFPGQLCITAQNHTPLIEFGGFGTTQELYARSEGRLATLLPSGIRSLANAAYELHAQGRLAGRTIGIVDRDFPGTLQTVTDGMIETLQSLGYTVAYRADLSPDDGTAASQIPLAVQQMRSHRVDFVMLLTDFITGSAFVQTSDRSAYRPEYFASDFEAMTNDTALTAMPPTFRAIGITATRIGEWRRDLPEPEADARCRTIYGAAVGAEPQRSDNAYSAAMLACGMIDLFTRAATGAGPELTRERYVAAMQQIGAIAFPNFGGMSWGPGKFDGADPIRLIEADAACHCWVPAGDFQPPHV